MLIWRRIDGNCLTEKIKIEKVLILKILVEVKRTMVETIARMYPHHFV